ncbi:zinc finger protein 585A-like [Mytilus trossulus]|uniref:zinc finger protein 585A-like n=1 Tax=Mytilus trossulus TaxID=6551 RepID=UPI003003C0F6
MECELYDGKGSSVPGRKQSVDSMLIIKQEVVDNAIESTVYKNYENLQELISNPTTFSNSRDRNTDDSRNKLLDEIKQEPCSPKSESGNNILNGYTEEWTYIDKTAVKDEDNKSNELKDRTDGVTDQIPYQDETDQEDPVMYIFNAENDMSELNDANENVNTGEVQNRRKRKGTKPKKIRQNVEKIEDLKYTCTTCDQRFSKKKELQMHTKSHNKDVIHICGVCGQQYKTKKILRSHARIHAKEQFHICSTCGEQFSKKIELKRHLKVHTGPKRHACDRCDKVCNRKAELIGHMRTHTGEKPFLCSICGKGFGFPHHLKGHLLIHTGEKPYSCHICGRGFNDRSSMRRHLKTHDPFETDVTDASLIHDESLKNESGVNEVKRFRRRQVYSRSHVCEFCGKAFIKGQHLRVHIRTHTGEKPHQCDVCGKQFNDPSSLRRHMRTYANRPHVNSDEKVKEYKCPICEKEFGYRRNYRNHVKTHSTGKQFECTTCGKSFHLKHHLRHHMTKHMVEKPYKCTICDKRFSNYSMWYCHFKTHNTKGDYKFQCSICTKFFLTGAHLKFHLKTHKNGNSKTSENNQLKSKLTVDIQSEDYICTLCNDVFQDKMSLRQHEIFVHEEELNGNISPVGSDNFNIVGTKDDDLSGQSTDMELTENNIHNDQSVLDKSLPVEQSTVDLNLINAKNMDAFLIQNALEESLNNSSESTEGQLSIEKESSKFSEHDDSYLDFSTCSERLKTASDIESKSENKQKRFDCSECSKSFSRKDSLNTHFRLHTGQNIHKCNLCGKIFPKRSNYIRHMESCGKRERRVTQNEVLNENSYSKDFTAQEQFEVSENAHGDNMINDKNMDALLIQNALEESLNNSSESTEGQLSIEKESSKFSEHDDSYLDFSTCSERLKTASDIESKSENKQKRFDCSECSKSFSRRDSLTTHFRLHTRQNIHECNLCGKIFPKRSNHIRHMESCGKRERKVTKHEVLNENSNSKDFTAIEEFDVSQNAHYDKATEIGVPSKSLNKPFSCDLCDKSFTMKSSLVTHYKLHTGKNLMECDVCGKKFTKSYTYLRHIRTHTGDKPHKCDYCERGFGDKSSLNRHLTTRHKMETPYVCHMCNSKFFSKSSLEKHVWTHDQESFDEMNFKDGSEDLPVRKRLPKIQFKSSELEESANDSSVCEMAQTATDEYSTEEPFDNTYMVQVKIEPEELE